jgi:hypothetical protein
MYNYVQCNSRNIYSMYVQRRNRSEYIRPTDTVGIMYFRTQKYCRYKVHLDTEVT